MGTITTISRCVVNTITEQFAIGGKVDIVSKFAKVRLDDNNTLFIQVNGYKECEYFTFGKEPKFTANEIFNMCINKAYEVILDQVGFKEFKEIR